MAFADFFGRVYAEVGDTTVIDRVSSNSAGSVTQGSDAVGLYLRVESQVLLELGSTFDIDDTGITVAILFRKQVMSNFYHPFAVDKVGANFGGSGVTIKHQSASDLRAQGHASTQTSLVSLGATSVGDLIGLVWKIPSAAAGANRDWYLWEMGAAHSGTDPDYTTTSGWSTSVFEALTGAINLNQGGAAKLDVYAIGVWTEELPHADCATLVESIYDSVRTGSLPTPAINGVSTLPAATQAALGGQTAPAGGAQTVAGAVQAGSSELSISGSGAQDLASAEQAGSETSTAAGDGAQTMPAAEQASTGSTPMITITAVFHNGSAPRADESNVSVYLYDRTTRELVTSVSGLTMDGDGLLPPFAADVAFGTAYRAIVEFGDPDDIGVVRSVTSSAA